MRVAVNRVKVKNHSLDIAKGAAVASGVSVAAILAFALALKAYNMPDTAISVINQVIKLISVAAGCYVCVGQGGESGFMKGASVGVLYMLLGSGLYLLMGGEGTTLLGILSDALMGGASGAIAGILIANLPAKPSK